MGIFSFTVETLTTDNPDTLVHIVSYTLEREKPIAYNMTEERMRVTTTMQHIRST